MITTIVLCSSEPEELLLLKEVFGDIPLFGFLEISEANFIKQDQVDIVHYYTAIMERFGSKQLSYDCQIIETGGQYDFAPYVVTSPAFGIDTNYSELEQMILQVLIPATKVLEFSADKDLVYAMHAEVSFIYAPVTKENLLSVKEILVRELKQHKVI